MEEDQDRKPVDCDNMEIDTGQNKEDISENNINDEYTTLEEKALAGKCHYKEYEKLIDYLREKGDINKLRKVWDNFASSYPLPADKWMKWIEDEEKFDPSRKQVFIDLFERALRDYMSFEIWLSYQNLCVNSNILDVNEVRAVMERAVSSIGLHVSMASLSWKVYRDFEFNILKSLKEKDESPKNEELTEQIRRIANLYRRQLAIPAIGLEEIYDEFLKWISDENIDDIRIVDCELVKKLYEAALEKLNDIRCFEETLSLLEPEENLGTYNSYIEHEKQCKWNVENVSRISCLYERAINDHRTVRYLWSDYIDYLIYTVKIPEDVLRVCERAVRNCTNSNQLWIEYLCAMERYNKSKEDIVELLEKSLSQKFPSPSEYRNVWLSYLYYLRRRLDKLNDTEDDTWKSHVNEIRLTIDRACEHLASNFSWNGDPNCELLVWGTRFEAEITRDMEIVRKTWSDILTAVPKKNSTEFWKKYLNMEWQYGDKKHMRKICVRALTACDTPNEIADIWVEYESLCGSLDSMLNCKKKIAARMKEFKIGQNIKKNEREKRMAKKEKVISPSKTEIVKKDKGKEKKINETNENAMKKELKNGGDEDRGTVMEHDGSKDDRTIFISNLDYTVGEDELALVFKSVGNIVETRLVKDFRGRSKGYCYMVFSTTKSAEEALKMDRTPIDKRPMFVSRCDPDKQTRKTGLRFNTGLEKNKLFVKGLPTSYEKKDVEELFKPFGQLKDVRLVTFRNGHSKGMAYVEYKDEVSAAHALLKTDGFVINDKPIKVVISDPPQKVDNLSLIPDSKTLGAGKITHGVRGRARTELSFVPRSVKIASEKSNNLEEKMEVDKSNSKNLEDEQKLTNTDFRKMLLGDK